ncbi:hypothetical protein Drorol1_Dr00004084 [Drosera rotundifolia]
MGHRGKVQPHIDQNTTKILNLTVLQRIDPFVDDILITAPHVAFYGFDGDSSQWSRKDVEGSLFVVKRNSQPRFQFIVMNRLSTDNLVEDLLGDFEYEVQVPYLLYRNASQEINGIWFYNARDCEEVANLFSRILNAFSKVPTKTKISSSKSEFEELEAVPTMAVMDGPLEPTSSTSSNVNDMPYDPAFVNFFSSSLTILNPASPPDTSILRQLHQGSATASPAPSSGPVNIPNLHPSPQVAPQPPVSSTYPLPLPDSSQPSSTSYQTTNLVKPLVFFNPSQSFTPTVAAPASSFFPTAPPLLPPLNAQSPYGTTVLQPLPPPNPSPSLTLVAAPATDYGSFFPPPNPPPSLTPVVAPANYGPVISRDKVKDALLLLVQDDRYIDMVYQAVSNAHRS